MNFCNIRKSELFHFFTRNTSYKSTLNLPKFLLPIKVKPNIDGTNVYDSIYKYIKPSKNKFKYVLHDGPPYANGNLHVGHALNKILKDISNNFKRIQGYSVTFKPGWDCHGLPIELKSVHGNSDNPVLIRQNACYIAKKYIEIQKSGFRSWGVAGDWNKYYSTLDYSYQSKEIRAFRIMYDKSLIFRDSLPTFWSCSSKTALAEAELEYNDQHCSDTAFVKFELVNSNLFSVNGNISVLIWTTTPWTLVANEAVGMHDNIKYLLCKIDNVSDVVILGAFSLDRLRQLMGQKIEVLSEISAKNLIGLQYRHPIIPGKLCPIVEAGFVTEDKGTGIVHIAPAHGKEDFHLIKSLGGDYRSVFVSDAGYYTDKCGYHLAGLDVLQTGSQTTLSLLGSNVLHRERLVHSYPYDWRTKLPVIIRLSTQWFVDVAQLADQALNEYEKVNVYPASMKDAMYQFIRKRPNWCISRQRRWGVPIPVLSRDNEAVIVDNELIDHIAQRVEKEGSDFWWSESISDTVPDLFFEKWNIDKSQLRKSEDIFDIWFDSGLSWWCSRPTDGTKQIDVCLEGVDQFRGWFSSSLLTGVALSNRSPYKNIVCHGFTVDGEGKKMSKSLGNVLDPVEIVNKYGVDVLRYWACSAGLTSQTSISYSMLEQMQKKYLSLRNLFRFLLGNISNEDREFTEQCINPSIFPELLPQDRYILQNLASCVAHIEQCIDSYQFSQIINALEEIESKISNFYFTIIKDRLYCDSTKSDSLKSCKIALMLILNTLIPICLPIFPCLTLEIIEALNQSHYFDKLPMISWPENVKHWIDNDVTQSMENLILPLRQDIHSLDLHGHGIKISNQTNPMSELSFELLIPDENERSVGKSFNNHSIDWQTSSPICEILRCASVKISNPLMATVQEESRIIKLNKTRWSVFVTTRCEAEKCARCLRYIKRDTDDECCSRCRTAMGEAVRYESRV